MLKKDEINKLSHGNVLVELIKAKKTLFETRFKVKSGQSKDIHKVKTQRKYVARLKTAQTASQTTTTNN